MTTAQPASLEQLWTLRKIAPEIQELNEIPLFGKTPAFDWNQFASLISSRWDVGSLFIEPKRQEWLLPDEITKGLGGDASIFPIDVAPLGLSAYWIMPKQEIKKLTSWTLSKSSQAPVITSDLLQAGFYQYLLLEALDAASEMSPFETLTPLLHEEASLPDEKTFCIDISLQMQGKTCSGRLAIPNNFRLRWKEHFETLNLQSISPRLAKSIELPLIIKTGAVLLHQSQWEKVKIGDFILLDRGSYDFKNESGLATLNLNNTPLFQLEIEKNKVHLLNFSFIYEDATDMTNNTPSEDDSLEEESSLSPEQEAESVSIKETPLHITIELARLQITLEKLMQLTPGNTLDLPIQPDQSVSLSVNGQRIGKAELVYLGERLGIRIIDLG